MVNYIFALLKAYSLELTAKNLQYTYLYKNQPYRLCMTITDQNLI